MGTHLKCLIEALQMSTHNICFYGEIRKKLSHNYHQILLLNKSSARWYFAHAQDESKSEHLTHTRRHFSLGVAHIHVPVLLLVHKATDKKGIHIIFFLFLHENIYCGYSLEVPRRGVSNEYPQHMFLWRNKKDISIFRMKKVPYRCYAVHGL